MRGRWVSPYVGKIQIERHKRPMLCLAPIEQVAISGSSKTFIRRAICLKTYFSKYQRELARKVLVNLKFQDFVPRGSSTVPSRASSAAYAKAASTSPTRNAG